MSMVFQYVQWHCSLPRSCREAEGPRSDTVLLVGHSHQDGIIGESPFGTQSKLTMSMTRQGWLITIYRDFLRCQGTYSNSHPYDRSITRRRRCRNDRRGRHDVATQQFLLSLPGRSQTQSVEVRKRAVKQNNVLWLLSLSRAEVRTKVGKTLVSPRPFLLFRFFT